ncbi:MAG: hypothetical protein ACLU9S_03045 [Oscillospiraceae bacterium]
MLSSRWSIFRENLDERLKKLSAEEKKDDLLTFEQLGVDMMIVDEAHFFKNCFVFTKLRNVAWHHHLMQPARL